MENLTEPFRERLAEIEEYLSLLDALDRQVQEGHISGEGGWTVSVNQQKMLYSSVYLQLYNLVESTVSNCLLFIETKIVSNSVAPQNLKDELKGEWAKSVAKTNEELTLENRLKAALHLLHLASNERVIDSFKFVRTNAGSWDDQEIDKLAKRLGVALNLNTETYSAIKRSYKDDKGILVYIKTLRNELAHGSISFVECGSGVTVGDLRSLKNMVENYLEEVLDCFQAVVVEI